MIFENLLLHWHFTIEFGLLTLFYSNLCESKNIFSKADISHKKIEFEIGYAKQKQIMIDATEFIHQIKQHKKSPEEYEHHEPELDGIHFYGLFSMYLLSLKLSYIVCTCIQLWPCSLNSLGFI